MQKLPIKRNTIILLLTLGLSNPGWVKSLTIGPVMPKFNASYPEPHKSKQLNPGIERSGDGLLPSNTMPRHLWRTFKNSV